MNEANRREKKKAFVFSGGGSLGAVQVGMLKALYEIGIAPDFCVGTSVGAINSAFLCGKPSLEGVLELERIWLSLRKKDIFPISILGGIVHLMRKKNHFLSPRGLRRILERHIGYQTLADARIPCLLIATDIMTGEQVVLSSGNTVRAVLASAALPGVFPPVEMAGRILIDGGVSSNTPLSVAVEYGAKEIFVLPAGYPHLPQRPPSGLVDILSHALNILIGHQFLHDIERFQKEIIIHILPPQDAGAGLSYDLSKTAEYIARAYKAIQQWLDTGGLDTFVVPGRLLTPNHWL